MPPGILFLTAVSLAVAAIPEALPAVAAISPALGAFKMVGQHALIAGVVITLTGWMPFDPLLSLVIGALIVASSLRLLREALHGLMEGVPLNLSLEEIGRAIAAVPGVASVHDLHVWSVAPDKPMLSAHLVVEDLRAWESVLAETRRLLHDRYGIEHVTLQPEPIQHVLRKMEHPSR